MGGAEFECGAVPGGIGAAAAIVVASAAEAAGVAPTAVVGAVSTEVVSIATAEVAPIVVVAALLMWDMWALLPSPMLMMTLCGPVSYGFWGRG